MKYPTLMSATLSLAMLAMPAWSQAVTNQPAASLTQEELENARTAADTMISRLYVREVPTYWTPSEVVAKLQELGYTNIHDFDVEWNHYEVEAISPTGEDVEIEVHPVTGTIQDIEENWF